MNERMDAGEGEESKGNTLIIALEGRGDRGARKRRDGGRGRARVLRGGSNGVFVLAGVTHKALAGAAQLSYRYQTQRARRECACLCLYWCSSCPAVYVCVSVMWLVWCICNFCVHSVCVLSALMLLQQASCSCVCVSVHVRHIAPGVSVCVTLFSMYAVTWHDLGVFMLCARWGFFFSLFLSFQFLLF